MQKNHQRLFGFMNSMKTLLNRMCLAAIAFFLLTIASHSTEYKFTVSCAADSFVVHWKTGDIDPGKEWLRVATGTENPNCSVGDFDLTTDGNLRVDSRSHEEAFIKGIPLVGPIFCAVFSC